jgi:long-chain acyl-CoA synthetase
MAVDTIPARLRARAKSHPDKAAYYVKRGSNWVPTSYEQYAEEVKTAAKAMMHLGLAPGGTVSILGFNKPEWAIFDLACMSAGGAPAGIYTTCSPSEVRYIIDHSESRLVLLEDQAQWKKVEQELAKLPTLEHIVMMKGVKVDHPKVMSWEDFMALGEKVSDQEFDDRIGGLKKDQLATFIYTSGTTGPPKGVMLSHENLSWTASLVEKLIPVQSSDTTLSYLPLSHIAEQMFSLHVPCTYGSAIYFAESIEKVPDNLKEVQPTVFFAVPRIWEKFHAGITGKMKQAKGAKKKIADWALSVGRRYAAEVNVGRQPGPLLQLQHRLATKLVYSKVKPAIGLGNARICVSGAAPVAKEILEFFSGLDLTVFEVYGQSEDTGPTSFNLPGRTKFGSVGPPLPGIEVKIAEDGEIKVKGPNVFLGYYKDEAATNETLVDGWLCSGDLGSIDSDGFLHITGRKKEIIITAGGKNIAPKNIEASLKNTALIAEAVVIGDRRKFLSALLWLDPEAAAAWAKENGEPATDLHKNAKLLAQVQKDVDAVNSEYARVEHIRKWVIPDRPLGIDTGELTPTLKVKRKKVSENFSKEIESMYVGDEETAAA